MKIIWTASIAMAISATAIPATSAPVRLSEPVTAQSHVIQVGDGWRHGYGGYRYRHGYRYGNDFWGSGGAFIAGALIGGALSSPGYYGGAYYGNGYYGDAYYPRRVYNPPRSSYRQGYADGYRAGYYDRAYGGGASCSFRMPEC